jgi:hypothetical protein
VAAFAPVAPAAQVAAGRADTGEMEDLWAALGLFLAVLVVGALGLAWWEHRRRLAEVERRLEDSENSRFLLERQADTLGARLAALSEVLAESHPSARGRAAQGDQAERAAAMSAAMNRMSVQAARDDSTWPETQPMIVKATSVPAVPSERADEPATPTSFAPTVPGPIGLPTPPR